MLPFPAAMPIAPLRWFLVVVCSMLIGPRAWAETIRVSVSSSGEQADGPSSASVLSADGRWVAFESEATNLMPGDENQVQDVFIHDILTGVTERVSVSSLGVEADGPSWAPSLSADGRYVAFHSDATNLIDGEVTSARHVYVRDRLLSTTHRVSGDVLVSPDGLEGQVPSISGDGRYVCFLSRSTSLTSEDDPVVLDVFVRDLVTGAIELVSRSSSGEAANQNSFTCKISGDGRRVLFTSLASNLDPSDEDQGVDVFVRDRLNGSTTLISDVLIGGEPVREARFGAISSDGRIAAFMATSYSSESGIWTHDLETGQSVLLDPPGLVSSIPREPFPWSLSADGRILALQTAYPLASDDPADTDDLYVVDRLSGAAARINVGVNGSPSAMSGAWLSLSGDGQVAAFTSSASDLVAGDDNFTSDVFVRWDLSYDACTPAGVRLCLADDRFEVTATWATGGAGPTPARAVHLTSDAGYFWFFDQTNVELVVKLLDACSVTAVPGFWFFAAGLTDVAVEIVVVDTETGSERRYTSEDGSGFRSVLDLAAFSDCGHEENITIGEIERTRGRLFESFGPSVPGSPQFERLERSATSDLCADEDTTICLKSFRFGVEVDWSAADGTSGVARAGRLSSDTGVFTFFDEANVEIVVKVLDACDLPGFESYWVFAAGLTSLEVEVRVVDSETDAVRTYQNAEGTVFETIRDTAAFFTCR